MVVFLVILLKLKCVSFGIFYGLVALIIYDLRYLLNVRCVLHSSRVMFVFIYVYFYI